MTRQQRRRREWEGVENERYVIGAGGYRYRGNEFKWCTSAKIVRWDREWLESKRKYLPNKALSREWRR